MLARVCMAMVQEAGGGSLLAPHMNIQPLQFPVDNFICIGELSQAALLQWLFLLSPPPSMHLEQTFKPYRSSCQAPAL